MPLDKQSIKGIVEGIQFAHDLQLGEHFGTKLLSGILCLPNGVKTFSELR